MALADGVQLLPVLQFVPVIPFHSRLPRHSYFRAFLPINFGCFINTYSAISIAIESDTYVLIIRVFKVAI